MLSFLGKSRQKPIGRHDAVRPPLKLKSTAAPEQPTGTTGPSLSAEQHVREVRKLAAKEYLRHPSGATFAVAYTAPAELHIEMAMQFMAYANEGDVRDGHDPFAFKERQGNSYVFQVI